MTGRRVLVTGARSWTDTATIRDALAAQWGDGTAVLVTGACPRGADALAEQCWTAWGGQVERHPADWQQHGRAAGFVRNADLVAAGADVCLAFVHGEARGTRHAAGPAARAGIPIRYYPHPEPDDADRDPRGSTAARRDDTGPAPPTDGLPATATTPTTHTVPDVPDGRTTAMAGSDNQHQLPAPLRTGGARRSGRTGGPAGRAARRGYRPQRR